MAASEIKLPGIGPVKKPVAILIGVGGVGLVFILYRQHANNSAANAASTDTTGAASSTSAGIDPQTGFPYGSAEDEQALSGGLGSGLGLDGGIDPETGLPLGSQEDELALEGGGGFGDAGFSTSPFGVPPTVATAPTAPTTNAEWDQTAQQNLEALGTSASSAATALARYLGHMSLTSDQANIVQIALAETGNPPTGTFAIIPAAPSPAPPPKTTTPPKPTTKTVIANGDEDIHSYALHNGVTEAQILALNPDLKKYEATGTHIPKGTKVKV